MDWLAYYNVNPWGQERSDQRAAVQSLWNRGAGFERLTFQYPYHQVEEQQPEMSDDEFLALLESDRQRLASDQPETTEQASGDKT